MKTSLLSILLSLSFLSLCGQDSKPESNTDYRAGQWYVSQESEMIFSFASFASSSLDLEQNMRWSPVFNVAGHVNYDVSENFGLNIGLGIRNVGFIAKFNSTETSAIDRVKFRTYNLGIPVGFKIGNLNQKKPFFLFAGYEFELPFHYKQKEFAGNDKVNKITGWFSSRPAEISNSLYAGVQLPKGFSIKFKYYLTEFFDSDTQFIDNGTRPIDLNANVFYFSITAFPFKDLKSYKGELKGAL